MSPLRSEISPPVNRFMSIPRLLALTTFAALVAPGIASAFDDPKALLDAVYKPYIEGQRPASFDTNFSARLKLLYAKSLESHVAEASTDGPDVGRSPLLAFDPFIEGQHSLLLDLAITDPVVSGTHAVATVSFHNFDHASVLAVSMVKEPDGWKVDDIASLGGTQNWLLSWLLQYDPFSVK